ncbi:MAG: sulfotransferase family 2 domain-containing protein [Pseudomonadota bacterium]
MPPHNHHFFMHIPKTAGTTLRTVLELRFDAQRTVPSDQVMRQSFNGNYPPIPYLMELSEDVWSNTQLLRGHYPWQLMKRFARTPVMLTMLREPVARSVSHLRHVRRNAAWAKDLSLADIMQKRAFVQSHIANIQTRMLTMRFALDDPSAWPADVNQPFPLSEESYRRALVTLRSFEFVGIQERFDESMALMFDMFRWALPNDFPRANESTDDVELDDELRRQLADINTYDLRLYDEAVALFEQRLNHSIDRSGASDG